MDCSSGKAPLTYRDCWSGKAPLTCRDCWFGKAPLTCRDCWFGKAPLTGMRIGDPLRVRGAGPPGAVARGPGSHCTRGAALAPGSRC